MKKLVYVIFFKETGDLKKFKKKLEGSKFFSITNEECKTIFASENDFTIRSNHAKFLGSINTHIKYVFDEKHYEAACEISIDEFSQENMGLAWDFLIISHYESERDVWLGTYDKEDIVLHGEIREMLINDLLGYLLEPAEFSSLIGFDSN